MASDTSLPRIFLLRHGETEWSQLGRHTGNTELPLMPRGEDDARRIRPRLQKITFDHVLCSPRLRARQTCELAGFAAQAIIEDDLREWNYGDYEGLTAAEIATKQPAWSIYKEGCPGGESAADITARADRLCAKLAGLSGNVAVFSHGHFLRILTTRWVGWPIMNANNLLLSTASLSILGYNHNRRDRPIIALWNETQDG